MKSGKLALEVGDFGAEGGNFVFQLREPLGIRGTHFGRLGRGERIYRGVLRDGFRNIAGQEMNVAGFLGARLARKDFHKRRVAIHEQVEGGVDGGEIVELVEAVGARAKFAGSLRSTKKENAEESNFVAVEVEDFGEAVFELGDAAVGGSGAGQALLAQGMERAANGVFVKLHNRITIRFLVGGVEDSVQGERVVVGGGDFFFDERAKDAGFRWSQGEVHGRQ